MFLSMVIAPEPGRRFQPLTTEMYLQRFNVAASRAKDQMWLFHSVTLEDVSNPSCMRFQLLDYCYGVAARAEETDERAVTQLVPEDRLVEPFDSLFEQRVCNRLLDRGYTVLPQYPVEGYHIDLVVVGAKARLAVECDGDEWHGPDAYEADLGRQRELERCGWRFMRIRESAFYVDPAEALAPLWEALEELEIRPSDWIAPDPEPEPGVAARDADPAEPGADHPPPTDAPDHGPADPGAVDTEAGEGGPAEPATQAPPQPPVSAAVTQPNSQGSGHAPEPARSVDSNQSVSGHSNGLARYEEFTGNTVPALEATRDQLLDGLVAVVEVEGPVIGHRLHQAYVKASGGLRVGKQIRKTLNSAVSAAVRRGLLVEENPLSETGVRPKTYRLPDQPGVRPRELGPRQLEEVPPAELAAVMRQVHDKVAGRDREAFFRGTLELLGLKRLTRNTEQRLVEVWRLLGNGEAV